MPSIYKMDHEPEVARVLEDMRKKLAKGFGVTVIGNRVTVRWDIDGQLVDVHMIVENVTTPTEAADGLRRGREMQALVEKYPDLADGRGDYRATRGRRGVRLRLCVKGRRSYSGTITGVVVDHVNPAPAPPKSTS